MSRFETIIRITPSGADAPKVEIALTFTEGDVRRILCEHGLEMSKDAMTAYGGDRLMWTAAVTKREISNGS